LKELHIKLSVVSVKLPENVEYQLFSKKRIFINNYDIKYICSIINYYYYNAMQVQLNFFNESKGYGFITDEETGKDIFVHASGINAEECEGDRVSYEEEEGRKGKVAAKVAVI
jgi:CspA family cold shock protein